MFITYDGQVKLVDFGIAKVLDSLNHTRVGVLKGKARYMAPEQISGGVVDRRADIFSVGIMLWEMLAGSQIWLGTSETEILRRVARGDMPALPRDASPLLQQICAKAMAFQADERYPTAEALRADLEVFLAQHATPSREHSIGAAITEMFREERTQIRQLIEAQLKGSLPGAGVKIPVGPGYQVKFAEAIRRESAIATGAVGMLTDPAQVETILSTEQADLVFLARELLRDPYWPRRAAQELGVKLKPPVQYERAW